MKLKDIKWLKRFMRFKQDAILKINNKDYTVQLQQNQDGEWIVNFIEVDSKEH